MNAKCIRGVSCSGTFCGIVGVGKPVFDVLKHGLEIERLIDDIWCEQCFELGYYKSIEYNILWRIFTRREID